MAALLGIAVRWVLLRAAHSLIAAWVLAGDPTVRQAQRRARRWGYRLHLELVEERKN